MEKFRMCANKSNKYFYLQIIDEKKKYTVFTVTTRQLEKELAGQLTKKNIVAFSAMVVEKLHKFKIENVFFDRNGLSYKSNIKLLIDDIRKRGIII